MSKLLPFYSNYLAALPRYQARGRPMRIIRRAVVLLILGGLLLLLVATVAGRWLSPAGPGWVLYWLHDNLFLPFKGYTYTLFFPTSLVWWLILALIAGLIVLSLLLDRSLLLTPHTWLLRRAVRLPHSGGWLLGAANLLCRAGIKPGLLQDVAQHELELALLAAGAQQAGETDKRLCRTIARLTLLEIQLHRLPPAPPITPEHLAAGTLWHVAFLALDLRRRMDIEKGRINAASDESPALQLASQMPRVLGLAAYPPAEGDSDLSDPFSPHQILLDLRRTTALTGTKGGELLHELQLSCYARVRTLHDWANAMRARGRNAPLADVEASSSLPAVDVAALPYLGRLALSLALHASWLTRTPELALTTLNAMEIVALEAELRPDAAVAPAIRSLLQGLPSPYAYSLTAQLASLTAEARWEQWNPFVDLPDGPLQPADYERSLDQADALYQAAGPGFWSPAD